MEEWNFLKKLKTELLYNPTIPLLGIYLKNIKTDDTILREENKEELRALDDTERGEWKSWLKTQHSKN